MEIPERAKDGVIVRKPKDLISYINERFGHKAKMEKTFGYGYHLKIEKYHELGQMLEERKMDFDWDKIIDSLWLINDMLDSEIIYLKPIESISALFEVCQEYGLGVKIDHCKLEGCTSSIALYDIDGTLSHEDIFDLGICLKTLESGYKIINGVKQTEPKLSELDKAVRAE